MRRKAGIFSLLLVVAFSIAFRVHAQEFRGTISGNVTDSNGAMVPAAKITVTEVHTGTVSHTTSDAAGQYTVPFLLPGTYKIAVKANGFADYQRTDVTLQSQQHLVLNLALRVGATSQSVIVTGEPPQLNLANGSLGQVISTQSVADLPLNGRTPTTLAELSVGVITTAAPQQIHPFDNNAGNQWSMGGTPNQVSEVLLDGSPDMTLLGALAYAPTEDSVAEVSVQPFATDASFGHTIGGVINQTTKSGTNSIHGTAYEFGQISGIDANTYFNNRDGKPTPVFHFNQYGLTLGGPVRIPRVYNGRDKMFWFFAWEGLKDSTPNTAITTVPTSAEESGDFSQMLTAGCNKGNGGPYTIDATGVAICNDTGKPDPNQLYNPFSATVSGKNINRQPIVNNQLTSAVSALNPIALNYMKLFPTANDTVDATAAGQDNYISNAPSVDSYDNEFGRLDYNLRSNDHVFFDMRHNHRLQSKNDYFGNGATGTTLSRENYGAALDNVYTVNPTTFLDTRLNWTRFNEVHGSPAERYRPSQLGFPSYMDSKSMLLELPYINFATGGSCGKFTSYQCLGATGAALDPTTSYQLFTDVVKTIGNHSLKFGFDGRQYRMSIQNFGNSSGSFTFNSSWVTSGTTGASQTFGGDLASFLLGLPSSGGYDLNVRSDYHQYYVGTFAQDDWQVNKRLTLNLGLRFDVDTPFEEKLGRTVNGFDPNANIAYTSTPNFTPTTVSSNGSTFSVNSLNTTGGLTFPGDHNGAVYKVSTGMVSPRFGFSYALDEKTVLRGGFGIFVMPPGLSNLAATGTYSSNALSNSEGFSASTSYLATTDNYQTPANTLSNPFPSGFTQPAGSSQGPNTFLGQSISFLAPKVHDIYSERWTLDVQRSLTSNDMVEVIYEGNHGVHLPVAAQNLNALPFQYLSTTPYRNVAMSDAYGKSVTNPFRGTLGSDNTTSVNKSKTVSFSQLLCPYPQFGCSNAVTIENQTIGQSWFDSAMVHWEHRMSHGLTLTANYSFSKMIEQDTFLNDQDTRPTKRISPFDHTHHFTAGGTYHLPFGNGMMFSFGGSKLWNEIFGGYVINGIYQFQTGAPIEFSADIPLQPGANIRQIYNRSRDTAPAKSGNPALNTAVFVTGNSTACPNSGPCDGSAFINGQYVDHYRTLPQTMSWVRQDGYNNLDASILKNFPIREAMYFQLRFESFNTLNHPVYAAPYVSSATNGNFGYITSVAQNSQPRQFQIGGRLVF